ncbi:FecR family protein [Variovorax sp. LT1R16]|uniref:FecR family protein n=1 Tax=Variovorax sp. LT1R16 TaxID=3443728 RepID=UPI003F47F796
MRTLDRAIAAAADWHTRREDGLHADEEAQFQKWLSDDPTHASAYADLDMSYAVVRNLPAEDVGHLRAPSVLNDTLPAHKQRAKGRPAAPYDPTPSGRSWPMPGLAAFATSCVLLVAGVTGWHQWKQPTFMNRYATERGQRLDAALPDGSAMTLDALTRAEVALYRDRREALLSEGQVMFTIVPDAGKPFRVMAGPARITVVGTRFSVRHLGPEGQPRTVEVSVEEGKVLVESTVGPERNTSMAALTAGQSVRVSASGALEAATAVPVSSVALWRKGLIRFSNTPLAEAIREMERYGPTRLVVSDPKIADLRIGGSFEVSHPEELAKVLPSLLPVTLVGRADGSQDVVGAR